MSYPHTLSITGLGKALMTLKCSILLSKSFRIKDPALKFKGLHWTFSMSYTNQMNGKPGQHSSPFLASFSLFIK